MAYVQSSFDACGLCFSRLYGNHALAVTWITTQSTLYTYQFTLVHNNITDHL